MEKVLITGANGLLGQKCVEILNADYQILGCDIHDNSFIHNIKFQYIPLDLTKRDAVKNTLLSLKPHYIVNTAAYTNVDGSEQHKELCWKTNVEGVQNLVHGANKVGAKIVHISSDYIFDGKNGPYKETDSPNAVGYYGKSKLASENVLHQQSNNEFTILRTMILYGAGINIRPNFVTWLLAKLKNGERVRIVNDQFGNPTIADDLALSIQRVIHLKKWDIYHVSGSELIDRYNFALKIADVFKLDKALISSLTTNELNQAAPRPLRSGFILDKIKNDLSLETMNIDQSLKLLKKQLKKTKS